MVDGATASSAEMSSSIDTTTLVAFSSNAPVTRVCFATLFLPPAPHMYTERPPARAPASAESAAFRRSATMGSAPARRWRWRSAREGSSAASPFRRSSQTVALSTRMSGMESTPSKQVAVAVATRRRWKRISILNVLGREERSVWSACWCVERRLE